MTDIDKGDLVQSLEFGEGIHINQILEVIAVGREEIAQCMGCGENVGWMHLKGAPTPDFVYGWCPNHFRKLSSPPDEALQRETDLDNPYLIHPAPSQSTPRARYRDLPHQDL